MVDGTDTRVSSVRGASASARGSLAPWQRQRVSTHIEDNISSSLRLLDLAVLARLSPSYFSRAFKGSFGEPFTAYVGRRRLQLAREMMLASSETLCRIATACGFADQAHLSRQFRRAEGIAPTLWRRVRPTYTKV